MNTKACARCKEIKPLFEFNKHSRSGWQSYCRKCSNAESLDHYRRNRSETMNESKFEQAHRGLSTVAKKVLDATPVDEAWNAPAISAVLRRRGIGGADSRITMGCLNTLVNAGLVVEPKKGEFRRVCVRVKPKQSESLFKEPATTMEIAMQKAEQPEAATPQSAASDPIDKLSAFAARLRDLANDMERIALDLAERAEKNEAETAKMRQLQALLKSLG